MDKVSKKILKYINKNSSVRKFCDIFTICDKFDLDYDIVKYHLNYLLSKNLIEYFDKHTSDKTWYYRSTLDGKMYFKNLNKQLFLSLCNGILFPITVTLLTNLVLFVIKVLLK